MDWGEVAKGLPRGGLADAFYVFGVHKCGSTLMHNMVRAVCTQAGFPFIDVPGIAFHEGLRDNEWSLDESLLPIFDRSVLFCGFRSFPGLLLHPQLALRERRFVLLVRDPRDALVSQFFSLGGRHLSHKLPKKNVEGFLETTQRTAHLDIDEYVLQIAGGLRKKFAGYREALDFGRGLVRRYEDVFFDKQAFLGDIFKHFGLPVEPAVIHRVAERHDIRPAHEDITKHIRKGTPGDHAEKLRPETIRRLNRIFREVAAAYGYDLRD